MKNIKRLILAGAVVLAVGATTGAVFAASPYNTPAEALAGLTGRTVEDVTAERLETGKTYGTLAADAEKQEEFKTEMLQVKKDILIDRVEAGQITQEQANEIITAIEENQAACDGTRAGKIGQKMGAGFGVMQGNGNGQGQGQGNRGFGQGGGICQVQ